MSVREALGAIVFSLFWALLFVIASCRTSGAADVVAARGPQASIVCPSGAVDIWPGQSIAAVAQQASTATAFCLRAGIHQSPTVWPRTGQSFTGEYGAIVEGGLAQGIALFAGQCSSGCSDVTIRNLVIRNYAGRNCLFIYQGADHWTVDHNEITGCQYGHNSGYNTGGRVTANIIHDNVGDPVNNGGYGANQATDLRFENNEFYRNGCTQKVVESKNVAFVGNYLHDECNAIWYDGDNSGSLISRNVIRNVSQMGVFYEVSTTGEISYNDIDGAGQNGVFVSTSQNLDIFGNKIANAFRGLNVFVSCDRRVTSALGLYYDLQNVIVHDNAVTLGPLAGSYVSSLGVQNCTTADAALYLGGAKNIVFQGTQYQAPDATARVWNWGEAQKTFLEWQAIPQDSAGTLNAASSPAPTPDPVPTPSDVTAPSVILIAPSLVLRKSSVNFTASASDDTGVVRVEFYRDSTLLCSDTAEPYVCKWNVPASPNRSYRFSAKAYDAAGNVGISNPVTVSVR